MTFPKARSCPPPHRRTNWLVISLLSALSITGISACGQGPGTESVGQSPEALGVSGTNVLGFETPLGWVVLGGIPSSTTVRTQGSAALAVTAPILGTTLASLPLSSGLAPLAALTSAGSSVAVDVQIPANQPNPRNFGNLKLFVSSPSHLVVLQSLGSVSLTGQVPGTFQTYTFPVTDFVRRQLGNGSYSDLSFTIGLDAPLASFGTYVFDNLRTQSPSTQQVGARPSVNVTALLAQSPPSSTPGLATFAPGTIQIPASFHVNVGDAGTGTALFELGLGSATNIACTYKASVDKTSYVFASCSTKNVGGDLVAASIARLTIQSADPAAPLTKIKAQLAYDALGDQIGTKLVPPIPTYWGQTLDEINAISQAFAQLQISAPPPQQRFVSLPIPSFALRQGDGSPINALTGAPPRTPTDPPFDFKGDLNNSPTGDPSGLFDAYYDVKGNISADETNQTFTSHFDVDARVGVVVLGSNPIDALRVTATVDTNNGGTSATGNINPTGTATFHAFLFGKQVESNTVTQQTGFSFNPTFSQTFDTPPIPIWIFSIQGGVGASAGVKLTGALAINGFQLTADPHASINANIQGGVNIGVASGGVDVTIQLVDVSLPTVAQLTLDVSTEPAVCGATLNASVDGSLQLTSGGGSVDLDASIGICPFCFSDSWNIFSWDGLNLGNKPFPSPFPVTISTGAGLKLPQSLCTLPLIVNITQPLDGASLFAGIDEPTSVSARRPPVGNQLVGDPIDCQSITWTSSDPGAVFSPSATGCNPSVTFSDGAAGTSQTLTATANDQFGETGQASVTVSVAPKPTGPVPVILTPTNGEIFASAGATFTGRVSGGSGMVTVVWTDILSNTVLIPPQTVPAGTNVSLGPTVVPLDDNVYEVVLTATDASGSNSTQPVRFQISVPQ